MAKVAALGRDREEREVKLRATQVCTATHSHAALPGGSFFLPSARPSRPVSITLYTVVVAYVALELVLGGTGLCSGLSRLAPGLLSAREPSLGAVLTCLQSVAQVLAHQWREVLRWRSQRSDDFGAGVSNCALAD